MTGADPTDLARAGAGGLAELIDAVGAEPRRHLAIPGTLNFRDVGGYRAAGGTIRWGTLFRSDSLHKADQRGLAELAGLGLRTVVDLRTSFEAGVAAAPVDELAAAGALTCHISLVGEDLAELPADLGGIYDYVIDRRGAAIGAAIRCLARPGALPALVHCTAGKDRTGIVVAIVLAVAGVPDQVIAADYALTGRYLDPEHTPTIGHVQESSGLGDRLTAALLASPPELIARTLHRVRERGGGVAGYLSSHGVTDAELTTLRAALVAGDGGPGGASGPR